MKHLFFTFLFALGLIAPIASNAAELDVKTCPGDYTGFLAEVKNENTRKEYFKDYFTLSFCQLNDIIELYDELDSLKDNFRSAAFACEETDGYKDRYKEIKMEVFFIRNIQKAKAGTFDKDDVSEVDAKKKEILEILKGEMFLAFVEEEQFVTEGELDDMFAFWTQKYDEKILNYAKCEEGAWYELTESWNSFMDTMESLKDLNIETENRGGSGPNVKINGQDVDKMNEEADTSLDSDLTEDADLKKKEEQAKQELGPEKSIGEIIRDFSILTFSDAVNQSQKSEETYDIELEGRKRIAKYTKLYGENGGTVATNLQSIINSIHSTVNEANTVHFPQINQKTKEVEKRYCR